MKKLDFIEIGTSDFETLIQTCDDNTYGLSIEPIKKYIDRLPNRPNVVKINAVEFIKIDTEGMDCFLLNNILDYYDKNKMNLPRKIEFESNSHNKKQDVDNVCDRLRALRYIVEKDYISVTTAIR